MSQSDNACAYYVHTMSVLRLQHPHIYHRTEPEISKTEILVVQTVLHRVVACPGAARDACDGSG